MNKIIVLFLILISFKINAQTFSNYTVSSVYNEGTGKMFPRNSSFVIRKGQVRIMLDGATVTYILTSEGKLGSTITNGVHYSKTTYSAKTGGMNYLIVIYKSTSHVFVFITNINNGVKLVYDLRSD